MVWEKDAFGTSKFCGTASLPLRLALQMIDHGDKCIESRVSCISIYFNFILFQLDH